MRLDGCACGNRASRLVARGEQLRPVCLDCDLRLIYANLPAGTGDELTRRQVILLNLIAAGLNRAQVAERLQVSLNTVKTHVQHAMGRLGAHTQAQAVAIAIRRGLL